MNVPEEIFWLGYCSEYGIGIEKDENNAFIQYQKSADMNNPNGMYQVGHCYYLGIGVEKDEKKAFTYFQKSAEAGNSKGIYKTAICYRYGVGVAEDYNKYKDWFGKDHASRDSKYGKCIRCNAYNTSKAWCQTCDPEITIQEWTSEKKEIDNYIKEFQLRINDYERMIEWIPFDKLTNIQKIEKSLFSATWLDGIRKIDGDDYNYMRKREPSCIVALKALYGSEENPFSIKEFNNYINCSLGGIKLRVYGLTQNPETKEYMMVYQYINDGSLYKYLKTNFQNLTWQTKLKILFEVSDDLSKIHKAGYIHTNLSSNKILIDQSTSTSVQSSISGLRLSQKIDENNSGSVYGIMPYIAPEVFLGRGSTQAVDIYSFGVIMSEMSTGQRPFGDYQYNIDLSMEILNGLRPEFASGTPSCYIELAKQCMDSDPQNRPSALNISRKLEGWNKSMEELDNAGGDEIRKQFF